MDWRSKTRHYRTTNVNWLHYISVLLPRYYSRADSRVAPSQWETLLQSNAVSSWLRANLESTLYRKPCNLRSWCHGFVWHGTWASYQIRKFAGAHAPGIPGTSSPPPRVGDSDMHHGTCVTHVPWCMPGSLTNGFLWICRRGETFPAFPAHSQPAILRIW